MRSIFPYTILITFASSIFLSMGNGCAKFNAPGGELYSLLPQNTPDACSLGPGNPMNITATTLAAPPTISATWTIPTNCPVESSTVRRQVGGFPADANSGTAVASSLLNFSDTGVLANGTVYYYKIFLRDFNGNYSNGATMAAIAGKQAAKVPPVADNSIVIDGYDTDAAWATSPVVNFSFAEAYGESIGLDPLKSGYLKMAYDSNFLYIYFFMNDKYIYVDNIGQPWDDDSVEIFLDMNFDRSGNPLVDDFQLVFSPDPANIFTGQGTGGVGYNTTWVDGATKAIVLNGTMNNLLDVDTSWAIEYKIPFANLGVAGVGPGTTIGFTFTINDDDILNHGTQHLYIWTTGQVFNDPSTWGVLQF